MPRQAGHREATRHQGVYAVTDATGRIRYQAIWRAGDGRQRSSTHRLLSEAVEARAAALTDRSRGVEAPSRAARRVTVASVAEGWLTAGVWRSSTRAAHEVILRRHVLPAFGPRPVASIRPTEVRAWVSRMLAAGAAASTVTARRNVLSAVLSSAVTDGLLPANPAAGVRVPAEPRTPEDRAAALTAEQVASLLEVLPARLHAYALTIATTGLRPSEAAGLTLDRINPLRRTVTVDRQLVFADAGAPVFGPVKTPASARTVPLPDALAAALEHHVTTYGTGADGLLFTTRTGAPLVRSTRGASWQRAASRVSPALPEAVRGWHALRHTYASTALAAGVDLATVSRVLGHKTIAETAATYAHALPGRADAHRNVVADAFASLSVG